MLYLFFDVRALLGGKKTLYGHESGRKEESLVEGGVIKKVELQQPLSVLSLCSRCPHCLPPAL